METISLAAVHLCGLVVVSTDWLEYVVLTFPSLYFIALRFIDEK